MKTALNSGRGLVEEIDFNNRGILASTHEISDRFGISFRYNSPSAS